MPRSMRHRRQDVNRTRATSAGDRRLEIGDWSAIRHSRHLLVPAIDPNGEWRMANVAKRLHRDAIASPRPPGGEGQGEGASECGVRSAECGVRSAECGVRSAECGVRSAECGVRSAECGVRSAECGVRTTFSNRRQQSRRPASLLPPRPPVKPALRLRCWRLTKLIGLEFVALRPPHLILLLRLLLLATVSPRESKSRSRSKSTIMRRSQRA
jgi:hypothetical protein